MGIRHLTLPVNDYDLVMPAKTFLSRNGGSLGARPGMELVDLKSLGILPGMGGGDRGYHATGDIITATADGVDINQLWKDYQDMLTEYNNRRNSLISFLTWRTTKSREDEFSGGTTANFEEASEFGEPVGIRPSRQFQSLGYTFKWWDLAARFTWQFLADADAAQVDAVADMAAEADNRNLFMLVMRTLFNTSRRTNKESQTVYPFYSGQAGDKPPDYGTTTFADSHQHFVTSGGATVTAANLEALQTLVREHGYNVENGYSLVLMINEAQEPTIRQFKSIANGGTGNYDFIPAVGTPGTLLPVNLQMAPGVTRPPASLRGMTVVGAYAEMTIVKNVYIPAGYMVLFVTGGEENVQNPVAIREHPNAGLRGLRLVKGRTPDYPLIDSFYNRGMGSGVRKRGAGAVMQITASGSYTIPAVYAWP